MKNWKYISLSLPLVVSVLIFDQQQKERRSTFTYWKMTYSRILRTVVKPIKVVIYNYFLL
ncbi:MAG TPA: hypothetical protein VLR29_09410 [Flavobacterium sp.]|nr:hypothetical protein [Flavobacterium sp.]